MFVRCAPSSSPSFITRQDVEATLLLRAAEVAGRSFGLTSPHHNFGCVIAKGENVVGEGFLFAKGTKCAELQAVEAAGELCRDATAFLNMEPEDSLADNSAVSALVKAGISRVVIGHRHPLSCLRGNAIRSLRSQGLTVEILGEELKNKSFEDALISCRLVNAPLLYRAHLQLPFSVLKYAMTLDGKIATTSGHASWISSESSRKRVFELRSRSDAVIIGGNTARLDDPLLTARNGGGYSPIRAVLSQSLNLPGTAKLWDTSEAKTIVLTQTGANKNIQKVLQSKGVEVVEFDVLSPRNVMDYCYRQGYLSVLWECGGRLAAPAVASGVIHKVLAFIAPKIVGGQYAPTPVGELGFIRMTEALVLHDVSYEQIGLDILVSGYLHPIPEFPVAT